MRTIGRQWASAVFVAALWLVLASRIVPYDGASAAGACLVLWVAPGWALARWWDDAPLVERLPLAFTLSVGLTGALGLAATAVGLTMTATMVLLAIATVCLLLCKPQATTSSQVTGDHGGDGQPAASEAVVQAADPIADTPGLEPSGASRQQTLDDTNKSPQEEARGGNVHPGGLAQAPAGASHSGMPNHTVGGGGRANRAAGCLVALLAVGCAWLALGGDNIARDRMWYLGYVTKLATYGGAIDWTEPMLGSGHVVARFAHNAWLVALAMAAKLSGVPAPWLFERVVPAVVAALMPLAAFGLARRIFSRPVAAGAAALTVWIVLTTRYPFFSPERYVGFGRFSEDKTVALLVLSPVLLALCLDVFSKRSSVTARRWLLLVLAALAGGLTHPLVYLLDLIAVFGLALLVWTIPGRRLGFVAAGQGPARGGTPRSSLVAATTTGPRRAAAALATSLLLAAVAAGTIGWQARAQVAGNEAAIAHPSALETDPVVRAHARMKRQIDVIAGGPITNPALLGEPLLLVALVGLWPAWRLRATWTGAFLLASTLPMLALAFVPFLAPLFGRLVLPWMVYRTLWAIPFGFLLAALGNDLVRLPRFFQPAGSRNDAKPPAAGIQNAYAGCKIAAAGGQNAYAGNGAAAAGPQNASPGSRPAQARAGHAVLRKSGEQKTREVFARRRRGTERVRNAAAWFAVAGVLLTSAPHFPVSRLTGAARSRASLFPDRATRELLEEIARLPQGARIAAAPGLAELIPAYAAHPVLAFSDRGTTVFSRSRRAARRRLLANALLIGMPGAERQLRNRIVGYYDLSATVFEGHHCDREAARIFRNQRYSLCLERRHEARPFHLPVFRAVAGPAATGVVLARLGDGIRCAPSPAPARHNGVVRWRRPHRFSGRPVAVDCRAVLSPPADSLHLRLALNAPRADEIVVYRIAARMHGSERVKRRGGIEFKGNPYGEVRVPGAGIERVRIRLLPATLPYLNVARLELTSPHRPGAP